MNSEYSIQRFTPSHYEDLRSLYKEVYGHPPSFLELNNVFDTNDFGLFTIGFLAIHNETGGVAAYYGVFPVIGFVNGKEALIAQSGATMTSPTHQKKGLFTLLATHTYEAAREEGVVMIFGFPNQNSLPGFQKKLNWKFTGSMRMLKLNASYLPLAELASKSSFTSKIFLWWAKNRMKNYALSKTSKFINESSPGNVKRNDIYLNYKLRNRGVHFIEVEKFKLIISVSTHLYLGEVERFKAADLTGFITVLQRIARRLLCGKIVFVLSENHWLYELLSERYHFVESLPIGCLPLTNSELDSSKFSFTVLDYDTFK